MNVNIKRALGVSGAASMMLVMAPSAQADVPIDEAIQLSWDGSSYTSTITDSFVGIHEQDGSNVLVPGDSEQRTLKVRNDGPTEGTLRISVINVENLDAGAPDVHHNPDHVDPDGPGGMYAGAGDQGDFYEDLRLSWDVSDEQASSLTGQSSQSFASLAQAPGAATPIYTVPMDQGEVIDLTMGYTLPAEATSGNKANVPLRLAQFDVLLEIAGEFAESSITIVTHQELKGDKDGDGKADVGDTIQYTFDVTNPSENTLTDVHVVAPWLERAGITVECEKTTLEPGETMRCWASSEYTVTPADLDKGRVDLTATAVGKDPDGKDVVSDPSGVTMPVHDHPVVKPDDPDLPVVDVPSGIAALAGSWPGMAALGALLASAGAWLLKRRRRSERQAGPAPG